MKEAMFKLLHLMRTCVIIVYKKGISFESSWHLDITWLSEAAIPPMHVKPFSAFINYSKGSYLPLVSYLHTQGANGNVTVVAINPENIIHKDWRRALSSNINHRQHGDVWNVHLTAAMNIQQSFNWLLCWALIHNSVNSSQYFLNVYKLWLKYFL